MNKEYWNTRYKENQTGWDLGAVSPPLKSYIDQLDNKDLKILIPGAGNAYEAAYLFQQGFNHIYICDIAQQPLNSFAERNPGFPKEHILLQDFFSINTTFDLILEQTFFCALPVSMRPNYVQKTFDLLNPEGVLAGLLFDVQFENEGPPYGGNREEYLNYFRSHFNIEILEKAINSIAPRLDNELFFKFRKK